MSTATNGSGQDRSGGAAQTATPPPPRAGTAPSVPLAPVPRGRRRPAMLALGVVLMSVGALAAVWVVNSAADRVSVLVIARDIPFGSVVTDDDLGRAEVSVDPSMATVAASQLDQVVGRVAAADLHRGSLVTLESVVEAAPPDADQVLVGVALPPSRLPAGSLHAGDRVLVVDTPPVDSEVPDTPPGTIPATVVRLGPPDVNGVVVVDVTVAPGDGPALAARSATGRIGIVLQPRGSLR